jgi:hypothetical protein
VAWLPSFREREGERGGKKWEFLRESVCEEMFRGKEME